MIAQRNRMSNGSSLIKGLSTLSDYLDSEVKKKNISEYTKSISDSMNGITNLEDYRANLYNNYSKLMADNTLSQQEKGNILQTVSPLLKLKEQELQSNAYDQFTNELSNVYNGVTFAFGDTTKTIQDILKESEKLDVTQRRQFVNLAIKNVAQKVSNVSYISKDALQLTSGYKNQLTGKTINSQTYGITKNEDGNYLVEGKIATPEQIAQIEKAKMQYRNSIEKAKINQLRDINLTSALNNQTKIATMGGDPRARIQTFIATKDVAFQGKQYKKGDKIQAFVGTNTMTQDQKGNTLTPQYVYMNGKRYNTDEISKSFIDENSLRNNVQLLEKNIKETNKQNTEDLQSLGAEFEISNGDTYSPNFSNFDKRELSNTIFANPESLKGSEINYGLLDQTDAELKNLIDYYTEKNDPRFLSKKIYLSNYRKRIRSLSNKMKNAEQEQNKLKEYVDLLTQ